jgi:hypothetical protein
MSLLLWKSEKNEISAEALKNYIKYSSDFSVYTRRSVAAFLDFALKAVEEKWTTKQYFTELHESNLYLRYFCHDEIHLSKNASDILESCVPGGKFRDIKIELLIRHATNPCLEHPLKSWTHTASSGLLWEHILIPHSRGESVLDAKPQDIEVLNKKRETIFDSIRNSCGEEISFNVILLLSNAWTIVYEALTKLKDEKRPIPKAVLHDAFMEAKFSEQYYDRRDSVAHPSYLEECHSFITASKSRWDHQKELNPELREKEKQKEEGIEPDQGRKISLPATTPQLSKKRRRSQYSSNGQVKDRRLDDQENDSGTESVRTVSPFPVEDVDMDPHEDKDPRETEGRELSDTEPTEDTKPSDFKASGINEQSHTTGESPDARESSNSEDGSGNESGDEDMGGTEPEETEISSKVKSGTTDRTDAEETPIIGPSEEKERPISRDSPTVNGAPTETTSDEDTAAENVSDAQQSEPEDTSNEKSKESEFFDGITPKTRNSSDPNQDLVLLNQRLCKDIINKSCSLCVSVLEGGPVDTDRRKAIRAIWEASRDMCKEFKVGSETNTAPVEECVYSSFENDPGPCLIGIVASVLRILSGIKSATDELQSELHTWLMKTKDDLDAWSLPYTSK